MKWKRGKRSADLEDRRSQTGGGGLGGGFPGGGSGGLPIPMPGGKTGGGGLVIILVLVLFFVLRGCSGEDGGGGFNVPGLPSDSSRGAGPGHRHTDPAGLRPGGDAGRLRLFRA